VRIDARWAAGDADNFRKYAAEWSRSRLMSSWPSAPRPWWRCNSNPTPCRSYSRRSSTRSAAASLIAWPGRAETPPVLRVRIGLSGKWPELLKQIAPSVTRAAVLRDATITTSVGQFAVIQAVAPSLGVELSPAGVRDAGEIERGVTTFARGSKWRSDRDGKPADRSSSQSDHRAGGTGTDCRRSTPTATSPRAAA